MYVHSSPPPHTHSPQALSWLYSIPMPRTNTPDTPHTHTSDTQHAHSHTHTHIHTRTHTHAHSQSTRHVVAVLHADPQHEHAVCPLPHTHARTHTHTQKFTRHVVAVLKPDPSTSTQEAPSPPPTHTQHARTLTVHTPCGGCTPCRRPAPERSRPGPGSSATYSPWSTGQRRTSSRPHSAHCAQTRTVQKILVQKGTKGELDEGAEVGQLKALRQRHTATTKKASANEILTFLRCFLFLTGYDTSAKNPPIDCARKMKMKRKPRQT